MISIDRAGRALASELSAASYLCMHALQRESSLETSQQHHRTWSSGVPRQVSTWPVYQRPSCRSHSDMVGPAYIFPNSISPSVRSSGEAAMAHGDRCAPWDTIPQLQIRMSVDLSMKLPSYHLSLQVHVEGSLIIFHCNISVSVVIKAYKNPSHEPSLYLGRYRIGPSRPI
jgi:hypothetical protein